MTMSGSFGAVDRDKRQQIVSKVGITEVSNDNIISSRRVFRTSIRSVFRCTVGVFSAAASEIVSGTISELSMDSLEQFLVLSKSRK